MEYDKNTSQEESDDDLNESQSYFDEEEDDNINISEEDDNINISEEDDNINISEEEKKQRKPGTFVEVEIKKIDSPKTFTTQFMKVSESGELVPTKSPYLRTKILDLDEEGRYSPPQKIEVRKNIYYPQKIEIPQPSPLYKGDVKFGSKIQFTNFFIQKEKGLVVEVNDTFFKLLNLNNDKTTTISLENIKNVELVTTYQIEDEWEDMFKMKRYAVNVDGGRRYEIKDKRKVLKSGYLNDVVKPGQVVIVENKFIQNIIGIVLGFTNIGFVVSGKDGHSYTVLFNDPSVRKIEEKVSSKSSHIKYIPTIYDIMKNPVDNLLRKMVRDSLFQKFSKIIPGIKKHYSVDVNDKMTFEELEILKHGIKPWGNTDIKISEGKCTIYWIFDGNTYKKDFIIKKDKEGKDVCPEAYYFIRKGYYSENFKNWTYIKNLNDIKQKMNSPEISEKIQRDARRKLSRFTNRMILYNDIKKKYGTKFFDLDGYDIKNLLNRYKGDISIFDAFLKTKFESMSLEKLNKLRGESLKIEIFIIMNQYFRIYTPDISQIIHDLQTDYIYEEFKKIKPSDKDQDLFENELVEGGQKRIEYLKQTYREFIDRYNEVKLKYENIKLAVIESDEGRKKMKAEIKNLLEELKTNFTISSEMYENITKKGYDLFKDIEKFEKECFVISNSGQTIKDYLSLAIYPELFITEPLKKYAKFFKEKIASENFKISFLSSASLPHYFPELAMNFESFSDASLAKVTNELDKILLERINHIAESYIIINNPSMKTKILSTFTPSLDWNNYITSISRRCKKDTRSGKTKNVDGDGNVIYEYKGGKKIVRMVDIPLSDMVICYNKEDKKFTCHSLKDIFVDIKKSDNSDIINPYTEKYYPTDFINKIKDRYPDEIKEAKIPSEIFYVYEEESDEEESDGDLFSEEESDGDLFSEEESDEEDILNIQDVNLFEEDILNIQDFNLFEGNISEGVKAFVHVYASFNNRYYGLQDDVLKQYERDNPHIKFFKIDINNINREKYDIKRHSTSLLFIKDKDNLKLLGSHIGKEKIQDFIDKVISDNSKRDS